jgi:hypothetical protein
MKLSKSSFLSAMPFGFAALAWLISGPDTCTRSLSGLSNCGLSSLTPVILLLGFLWSIVILAICSIGLLISLVIERKMGTLPTTMLINFLYVVFCLSYLHLHLSGLSK